MHVIVAKRWARMNLYLCYHTHLCRLDFQYVLLCIVPEDDGMVLYSQCGFGGEENFKI